MSSINKAIIIGNATKDPELRFTPSGSAVCAVGVATNRKWKDKAGDRQEEVEYHRVVFYDKLAEVVGEYVKKGKSIYVEGRLKTRKWQDKDGKDVYTTEVIADNMQLLGSRDDSAPAPSNARPAPSRPAPSKTTSTAFDDMPSDVPF